VSLGLTLDYFAVDLDEFFLLFYRQALGNSPTLIGPDHFPAGTEASLDIQYIMSVGTQSVITPHLQHH
jgi:hypothetical protein